MRARKVGTAWLSAMTMIGVMAGCSRENPTTTPPAAPPTAQGTTTLANFVTPATGQPLRTSTTGAVFSVELPAEFVREVLSNSFPVLVMFHQRKSAPCVMMLPTLHRMARDFADQVCVAEVDISKPALRKLEPQYTILSVPTFVFFRAGREQYRLVGTTKPDRLAFMIETKLLAPGTIPPHRK
ncbi:MAG: thioredoxin family protein [bacterium]|nr:thioredoxin family protein [bacterium]